MATKAVSASLAHGMMDWAKNQKKRVYNFNEGSANEKKFLSYKGANLCEMLRLGLPVPPGMIISAETCDEFFHDRSVINQAFMNEVKKGIQLVEKKSGKKFPASGITPQKLPLLFSVRSGAAVNIPGIQETVLNIGINDEVVDHMARVSENARWAFDTYRRFLQMYGTMVMRVDPQKYEDIIQESLKRRDVSIASRLDVVDLKDLVAKFKLLAEVPSDPWEQLRLAIEAVFHSWYSPKAVKYRDVHNIPSELGTAVIVQSMVYGNINALSGTGFALTRDHRTGAKAFNGWFMSNAAGEDVLNSPVGQSTLTNSVAQTHPKVYEDLVAMADKLEKHFRDMQEIEFTIENMELYVLETRSARRSARAAATVAVSMVEQKLITEREALLRLNPQQMEFFIHPMIDPEHVNVEDDTVKARVLGTGLGAAGGAAVGKIALSSEQAKKLAAAGEKCILVKYDTNCSEDIGGLVNASASVTVHGGNSSHAPVVMRSLGRPAVCNVRGLTIDAEANTVTFVSENGTSTTLNAGDLITVDGSSGLVYSGELAVITSDRDAAFIQIMHWANKYKRMGVFASSRTSRDVELAYRMGAEGLGLCRTEHMFFNEQCGDLFRRALLSETPSERREALQKMVPHHTQEFLQVYKAMHNRQAHVIIRLLDHPLTDFLPDPRSDDFENAVMSMSARLSIPPEKVFARIRELQEVNPAMGTRGARMMVLYPEIVEMQVEAMIRAAIEARKSGVEVKPQIMLPMVCTDHEIDMISPTIISACDKSSAAAWTESNFQAPYMDFNIASLVDVPRACFRADRIAKCNRVNMLTIDTRELTQAVFGFSRNDVHHFMPEYLQNHLVHRDPFVTVDLPAVGALVEKTVHLSKKGNKGCMVGVCGEHGSDPDSLDFFENMNIDFVTCSPYKVPIAKIAAAQAHIRKTISTKAIAPDGLPYRYSFL